MSHGLPDPTNPALAGIDLDKYPTAKKLADRCLEFFNEVQNLSPGAELEKHLNAHYGPGNAYYEDFCALVRQGLDEGWVAFEALDGPRYRRSRVLNPSERTRFFSITTVWMDSESERSEDPEHREGKDTEAAEHPEHREGSLAGSSEAVDTKDGSSKGGDDKAVYSGQYHAHPYGEINCVVQIDASAELKGMQGWQGAGWTSPGAGTHHYPQVRGGRLVALFFLPAGRISYEVRPGERQPHCV